MKITTITSIFRHGFAYVVTAVAALLSGGCESMVFDGTDCVRSYNIIRLKYDRNMKFADAFDHEVEKVSLFAFSSADGKLVQRIDVEADKLTSDNEVVLEVEPGEYDLLVWAGRYDESFDIESGTPGRSVFADFDCRMRRSDESDGAHVRGELARLYHGSVHVDCPYASPTHPNCIDIGLTKDVNTVRIVLQQLSGDPLDCSQFNFEIRDANGWLNADNSLRDDVPLVYHPWDLFSGDVEINSNPVDAPGNRADVGGGAIGRSSLGAALAEFTVGRLMWGADPRLVITDSSNPERVIVDININEYAMLVRGYYNRDMDPQEYLDRQDEYNMTFFLDRERNWIKTVIIINDWRIVRHVGPAE